jgi:hypothetical protein
VAQVQPLLVQEIRINICRHHHAGGAEPTLGPVAQVQPLLVQVIRINIEIIDQQEAGELPGWDG